MATFVQGGSAVFDSLAYGDQHPATQEFLQNQCNTSSHVLTEAGARFMSGVTDLYNRVSGDGAIRIAKAAARSVQSIWNSDIIVELTTIGRLQHARPVMQRWIMAEPTVRNLYHQQRVDGYSGSYVDVNPGLVGEDHYDYRRATDGLVTEREDGIWQAECYFDELLPDDTDLILDEQIEIQSTWAALVDSLRAGKEDPTSVWNADL